MSTDKKELAVAALRNGTVIDHIPSKALFKAVDLLGISDLDKSVTIGYNLQSSRLGSKGIIKVADTFFAQSAVINTIKDFEVIKKEQVSLPDEVVDLVVCNNPKCITRNEPMKSRFEVIDRDNVTLKCCYCEHEATGDMLSIK